MKKVSVIVPVYNVEKYLERCLDSILAAKDKAKSVEVEIICVNDGSPDNCAEILERYSDRVKVITQENQGLGPARNTGLDAMTGDYVMFVDSDDVIPEDAIAKLTQVAEESSLPLVVSMDFLRSVPEKRLPRVKWTKRENAWIVGKKVEYSACNKLYVSSLFKNRRFPATLHEDYPVTTSVFCDVEYFAAVEEPMYVYCNNGTETIVRSKFSSKRMKGLFSGIDTILEIDSPYAGTIPVRQVIKGLATLVSKVTKAKDPSLTKVFLLRLMKLLSARPELARKIPLKAKLRLWKLKRSVR